MPPHQFSEVYLQKPYQVPREKKSPHASGRQMENDRFALDIGRKDEKAMKMAILNYADSTLS